MSSDPYVYPGTTVLKNIRGIRNQEILDRFEGDRVGQRSLELLECPLFGAFDVEHLRGIHRYLFQDVYEWAGEFRTVDIAKGNSYFTHVPYIESTLKDLFERLSKGQHTFVSADHIDRDPFMNTQTRERALNAAIVLADISESFEEYLAIFDAFYADDIEASSETGEEPIRGKARVRSLLFNFLVPPHVMAEVGGLSISIRETAIPGDAADERHSAWTLDLVGVSGRTCTLSWCTLRKWKGSRVVYEHHYDHRQSGGPLTSDDLSLNAATSAAGFRSPS